MNRDEKDFEQVGNIRIKQIKRKEKKKKSSTSTTPIGVKIFVWFMFFAMLASFAAPLVYYFITYALGE